MSKANKSTGRYNTLRSMTAAPTGGTEPLGGLTSRKPRGLTPLERQDLASELTHRTLTPPLAATRGIVGYVRSNLGSDEIARLRRDLEAYVRENYGRHLDAFYQDDRAPGPAMNTPSIRRLMTDANAGLIGMIVVTNADEIAQNRHFRASFARFCGRLQIEVHTPDHGHLPPFL